MQRKYDFLVIGTGIAGMSFALKVADAGKGRVALVCKTTLDEAIFKIQSNTRRYCRKQLTWFKRDEQIHWFDLSKMGNDLQTASEKIIKYIESLV